MVIVDLFVFDFSLGIGFSIAIHSMGSWVMNPTLKWGGKEENGEKKTKSGMEIGRAHV